jgi:hypothetical protein
MIDRVRGRTVCAIGRRLIYMPAAMAKVEGTDDDSTYLRRHLRVGWWSLFWFGAGGLVLEALHGLKVSAYLDATNDARRLTWTLAHAHGTLLGLVHVLFALSLRALPEFGAAHRRLVSLSLIWATVLLPGGFLLGGVFVYGGDPGLAVLLVPFGAVLFLLAALLLGRASISAESARSGRGKER